MAGKPIVHVPESFGQILMSFTDEGVDVDLLDWTGRVTFPVLEHGFLLIHKKMYQYIADVKQKDLENSNG